MKYERILLKVSGEVLSGKTPIDFDNVMVAAGQTAYSPETIRDSEAETRQGQEDKEQEC